MEQFTLEKKKKKKKKINFKELLEDIYMYALQAVVLAYFRTEKNNNKSQ